MENNEIVTLELDYPRELKLTHKALKRICSRLKIRMTDMERAVDDYEKLTVLVFEMLRVSDPGLSEKACDDLLDLRKPGEIVEAASMAIAAAFPHAEETEDPTMSPTPGTGTGN